MEEAVVTLINETDDVIQQLVLDILGEKNKGASEINILVEDYKNP